MITGFFVLTGRASPSMSVMLLSEEELGLLVAARHGNPHSLLGMHSLGDRSGVVVRAFFPGAAGVAVVPAHEVTKPRLLLERIHNDGVFEGVTGEMTEVYSHDFVVTDGHGRASRLRDPYSFGSTLSGTDLYSFGRGDDPLLYEKLGAHLREVDGVRGTGFAAWAPNARRVSVVGDFNCWDGRRHMMRRLDPSGVWEIFIPDVGCGAHYKFEMVDAHGQLRHKTDPFGFFFERAPKNAAIVWDTRGFGWTDHAWLRQRRDRNLLEFPMSIYEVHLGSWRKRNQAESLSYLELASELTGYVLEMGFTHVEFMPVAEHAYYPSWGYQVTGFYSPTGRYGNPDEFQCLINAFHEVGIGVIVDWVPAHFPRDDWALGRFDGTALFEHEDPRRGEHPDWGTYIFNYGRNEVRNFLAANALYWCDRYHVDGLRVDAVASMLYLDYSRKDGEWLPNKYGGRENTEAVDFLRHVNHQVQTIHPGVATIAEESTAWPGVSKPCADGGLGFSLKWNMGWMHDNLDFLKNDPIHRKHHLDKAAFGMVYHYEEHFVLPLSHDEVVHEKGSLIGKMPGDDWQRFANLRLLLGYQWTFPGKQLLFMGGEFGQPMEWDEDTELEWQLTQGNSKLATKHQGVQRFVRDLNFLYQKEPALWEADQQREGFQWINCDDRENTVISFLRRDKTLNRQLLVVLNFTPIVREDYRVGAPADGFWDEVVNSDSKIYGGTNAGNQGGCHAKPHPSNGFDFSLDINLPPLAMLVFEHVCG